MGSTPFLKRVSVRAYKSIAECDVTLSPLTLLVGRNGAGKSNFLDAIALVRDALDTTLDQALRSRGGIENVQHFPRPTGGRRSDIRIGLTIDLPDAGDADYVVRVGSRGSHGDDEHRFIVKEEELTVRDTHSKRRHFYRVRQNRLEESSVEPLPDPRDDRLFLTAASAFPVFAGVYEVLTAMGFYNLNPAPMRELRRPDSGDRLHRDGSNIASVVARIMEHSPDTSDRINEYLGAVVPGLTRATRAQVGGYETIDFEQSVSGHSEGVKFRADSMSEGTLRALGLLVAVMQFKGSSRRLRLVGIEEPETALHPAALTALMDALREATGHVQVVVTTHSPELLDLYCEETESLLVVEAIEGKSRIGPADNASREAIRQQLYTAGELLRIDQLAASVEPAKEFLFDEPTSDDSE